MKKCIIVIINESITYYCKNAIFQLLKTNNNKKIHINHYRTIKNNHIENTSYKHQTNCTQSQFSYAKNALS